MTTNEFLADLKPGDAVTIKRFDDRGLVTVSLTTADGRSDIHLTPNMLRTCAPDVLSQSLERLRRTIDTLLPLPESLQAAVRPKVTPPDVGGGDGCSNC